MARSAAQAAASRANLAKAREARRKQHGSGQAARRATRISRNAAKVHARETFGTKAAQNVKFAASKPNYGAADIAASAAKRARKSKRAKITVARKANQADVAYQKANPGTPVTRLSGRSRYDKSGKLRVKGKVGSRLRKGR